MVVVVLLLLLLLPLLLLLLLPLLLLLLLPLLLLLLLVTMAATTMHSSAPHAGTTSTRSTRPATTCWTSASRRTSTSPASS